MFNKKTPKELWLLHRDEFLKIYADEMPQGDKIGMEKAFVDLNGKQYYRFTGSSTILPLERMGKMQDFITMMAAGLDDNELDKILEVADRELAKAFDGKKPDVLKIGAALSEIRQRRKMILHDELLYQFMAVQYVREDEKPGKFTQTIHDEKVQAMKELVRKNGDYSFFLSPELSSVNAMLRFSEEDWKTYLDRSIRERDLLQKKLSYLNGVNASAKGKPMTAPI